MGALTHLEGDAGEHDVSTLSAFSQGARRARGMPPTVTGVSCSAADAEARPPPTPWMVRAIASWRASLGMPRKARAWTYRGAEHDGVFTEA
jgi:hypothetical protein